MRSRRGVAVLTVALVGQSLIATPSFAQDGPRVETIATGLDNPRGIDVADDGTVYVAEAGPGGDDHCVTIEHDGESDEVCMGATATVSAVPAGGAVAPVVTGLPSLMLGEGEFLGAADVAVADDGSLFVAVGLGGDSDLRDSIAEDWSPADMLGTVQHFEGGALSEVADLAQWVAEEDPHAGQPSTQGPQGQPSNDSNPNGLLTTSDGDLLAVDAGGNSVVEIEPATGEIALRAHLEDRTAAAPPFLGLPPGTQIPMQPVPTNLAEDPDGDVVVGDLTGFPFPVGGANVWLVDGSDGPELVEEGFTNIMDVVYLDGELYVLELARNGLLSGDFEGALVRVRADGTRTSLLRDLLVAPGGVAAGPDGMLYITNDSIGEPGSGSVIRFDPSLAADQAIRSACPPLEVPGTSLSDIAGTTHEEAITCTAWHGLFRGFADGTFRPGAEISRGQVATTVARLVRATGADLPDGSGGRFTDVDGTTHAMAINALEEAGIVSGFSDGTFRPRDMISRAQVVSILVAAYEYTTDSTLPAGGDAFDDIGGVHAANIEAAAARGWVRGTAPRTFSPRADISRGQMASTLARVAADLVDGEFLTLPE